jgi:hypothetical protein
MGSSSKFMGITGGQWAGNWDWCCVAAVVFVLMYQDEEQELLIHLFTLATPMVEQIAKV